MADPVSTSISVLALLASGFTAWMNLLRRGALRMPEALAKQWEEKTAPVTRYVFPKELNLPHELIDPTEEGANTAISHPKIIELAERSAEVQRRGTAS